MEHLFIEHHALACKNVIHLTSLVKLLKNSKQLVTPAYPRPAALAGVSELMVDKFYSGGPGCPHKVAIGYDPKLGMLVDVSEHVENVMGKWQVVL